MPNYINKISKNGVVYDIYASAVVDEGDGLTAAEIVAAVEAAQAAGVGSFNGRTGTVVPVSGDYSVDMVTNAASTSNVATAKSEAISTVVGAASDTKDADTIKGAKKYADDAANGKDAAITAAQADATQALTNAATAKSTADAKVASVSAGDKSITVGGTTTAPTVSVTLDDTTGNALRLVSGKGLRVDTPDEYSIVKDANSGDYAAIYHLTKAGVNTGVAINIPKDMVIQSGTVETNPTGQPAGTYLVLTLANATSDTIYINVSSLIEYVTSGSASGDMVVINISNDHKVTATITDGTITLAKLENSVQTKINQAHSHDNKTALDSITSTKITNWDNLVTNAPTTYARKVQVLAAGSSTPAGLSEGDIYFVLAS